MPTMEKIKQYGNVPEIEILKRFMDLILIIDMSTSMQFNCRMAILNQILRELMPELKQQEKKKARVQHRLRCLGFSNHPTWIIGPDPISVADASWTDLSAAGTTATGEALNWIANSIAPNKMPARGYPPVIVLISDGDNTDGVAYKQAIDRLNKEPWGKRAIRVAIGIGTGYDRKKLEMFTNTEAGVLEARNSAELLNYLRYATITVPNSVSDSIPDPKQGSAVPTPPNKVDSKKTDKKPEVF